MIDSKSVGRLVRLKISKTTERKIRKGYPWVFDYQLRSQPDPVVPAGLGVIYDSTNRFLALGLYDPNSPIRMRILQSEGPTSIDEEFFRHRLERAWEAREFLKEKSCDGFRVVNGENDGLPGLILDCYGETLVAKIYTAAWFFFLPKIERHLGFGGKIKRCVLRLSRNISDKVYYDGKVLFGSPISEPTVFWENGLKFQADVLSGQKTGFYFDQRDNRQHIRGMARDKTILNVFSYTGAFSIYAFAGGCKSVLEIDYNPHALRMSRANLKLNFPELLEDVERFTQIQGDAFELLNKLDGKNMKFDLVILDPPAMASGKRHKLRALDAYERLARMGARITKPGGFLFAASCSRPIKGQEFFAAVRRGIGATGRRGKEFLKTGHALDHPITFEEGIYLKAVFWSL